MVALVICISSGYSVLYADVLVVCCVISADNMVIAINIRNREESHEPTT